MKINRFGKAEVLTLDQINVLFNEGFVKSRDKALFGVCLYAACRINKACTLFTRDVFGSNGIRQVLLIRSFNTKGKRDTREIQIHPTLRRYLEEYNPNRSKDYLFPGGTGEDIFTRQVQTRYLGKRSTSSALRGLSPIARRRTALTRMSDAGVPLRHIQSISGHRTLSARVALLGRN